MLNTTTPLILPVENQVREFDAKLLLALVAAERAFPVIIGSRFNIHFAMPSLPRGVVIAKSMRSVSSNTLRFTRGLGHHIVAWDEEGLVRFDSNEYYAWRYAKPAFQSARRLFAWGEDDAASFRRYDGYEGVPIHVTGNPRVDLLRPDVRGIFDEQAAAISEEFGDFVLINTNFSFVNNFVENLNLVQTGLSSAKPKISRTGEGLSVEFASGMAAHQQRIFDAFRAFVPRLAAKLPHYRIVFRPHPSENHDVWRHLLKGHRNVHVRHDGNVVPWLMACRVLLHNGCTTAVEGAVLDKPAVAYRPVASPIYDYALPNSLSVEASSEDAVYRQLLRILSGDCSAIDLDKRSRLFDHHLASTEGRLASDRVIDALCDAGYAEQRLGKPGILEYCSAWLGMNGRTLLQRINMHIPNSRHSRSHLVHRFPPMSLAVVNSRIETMRRHLGRFDGLSAKPISENIFTISK